MTNTRDIRGCLYFFVSVFYNTNPKVEKFIACNTWRSDSYIGENNPAHELDTYTRVRHIYCTDTCMFVHSRYKVIYGEKKRERIPRRSRSESRNRSRENVSAFLADWKTPIGYYTREYEVRKEKWRRQWMVSKRKKRQAFHFRYIFPLISCKFGLAPKKLNQSLHRSKNLWRVDFFFKINDWTSKANTKCGFHNSFEVALDRTFLRDR